MGAEELNLSTESDAGRPCERFRFGNIRCGIQSIKLAVPVCLMKTGCDTDETTASVLNVCNMQDRNCSAVVF